MAVSLLSGVYHHSVKGVGVEVSGNHDLYNAKISVGEEFQCKVENGIVSAQGEIGLESVDSSVCWADEKRTVWFRVDSRYFHQERKTHIEVRYMGKENFSAKFLDDSSVVSFSYNVGNGVLSQGDKVGNFNSVGSIVWNDSVWHRATHPVEGLYHVSSLGFGALVQHQGDNKYAAYLGDGSVKSFTYNGQFIDENGSIGVFSSDGSISFNDSTIWFNIAGYYKQLNNKTLGYCYHVADGTIKAHFDNSDIDIDYNLKTGHMKSSSESVQMGSSGNVPWSSVSWERL